MALLDKLTSGSSTPPDTSGMSKQAKLVCELVADFNSNNLLTQIRNNNRSKSDIDKTYKYPDHFTSELIETKNFKMELLKWKNSHNPYVVLQIHGGGYVGDFKTQYRMFAGLYSELGKGASVLSIDYRVAPENPYPAALNDALYAYDWLLNHGYSENHIILAGDSAGGGLAMALCHYLTDRDRILPAGIVAMSPWTDLTASGPSYQENYEKDPLFGNTIESMIYNGEYVGKENPKLPYISPLFGVFPGLPPLLFQAGSLDMLLCDSVVAAEKAKKAGCDVTLTVYQEMFHVFQLSMDKLAESREAWEEIRRFLRKE